MKNFFNKIERGFLKVVVGTYCRIVYKLKVVGKENIPKEGNIIFCGNHRSYLDPPLMIITNNRDMRFMAKEELKSNFLFSTLIRIFDGIYVKRDEKDISAMKEALKTLKSGGCIAIFPEGTRNGFEKNEGEIKNGAAYMALKTNSKVVPIGIVGPLKPFTKNAIVYGKPIDMSKYITGKKIEKELEDKASETIKNEILKLSNIEI